MKESNITKIVNAEKILLHASALSDLLPTIDREKYSDALSTLKVIAFENRRHLNKLLNVEDDT